MTEQPTVEQAQQQGNGAAAEPPEPPESPVAKRIRTLVDEFEAELATRLDERAAITQRHEQELASVDDDIKHIQNAIAGLTGKPAPALKKFAGKRKRQPGRVGRVTGAGTATGFGVSLEVALVGAKALLELVKDKEARGEPGTFTQKEFYRNPHLDWDQSRGSQAIRYMRNIGFIRKAGRHPETQVELWAIMDAEAMDREAKRVEQRTEEHERRVAEQAQGGSLQDRVVDAVREAGGEIKSISELARLSGVNRHTLKDHVKSLEENNVIVIRREGTHRGAPTTITLGDAA